MLLDDAHGAPRLCKDFLYFTRRAFSPYAARSPGPLSTGMNNRFQYYEKGLWPQQRSGFAWIAWSIPGFHIAGMKTSERHSQPQSIRNRQISSASSASFGFEKDNSGETNSKEHRTQQRRARPYRRNGALVGPSCRNYRCAACRAVAACAA